MSALNRAADPGSEAEARFVPVEINGSLTVWDAEDELYLVHEAPWDVLAACTVAESLNEDPIYVGAWVWAYVEAVSKLERLREIRARLEAAEKDHPGPWTYRYWPAVESGWDAELSIRCEPGGEVFGGLMGSLEYMRVLGHALADLKFLLGELSAVEEVLAGDRGCLIDPGPASDHEELNPSTRYHIEWCVLPAREFRSAADRLGWGIYFADDHDAGYLRWLPTEAEARRIADEHNAAVRNEFAGEVSRG